MTKKIKTKTATARAHHVVIVLQGQGYIGSLALEFQQSVVHIIYFLNPNSV